VRLKGNLYFAEELERERRTQNRCLQTCGREISREFPFGDIAKLKTDTNGHV
jgi:hypothetical protein